MRKTIKEIIETVRKYQGSCLLAAKELGIHRTTVYRWKRRTKSIHNYGELKWLGVQRSSTRPKRIKRALCLQEQSAIIKVREQTGFAAVKIKGELQLSVGINTIHRFNVRDYSMSMEIIEGHGINKQHICI